MLNNNVPGNVRNMYMFLTEINRNTKSFPDFLNVGQILSLSILIMLLCTIDITSNKITYEV